MTPARYDELLKALKAIQKKVAADLLAAGRKPGAVRDRLLVRHREEEVGGSFDEWLKVAAARAGVQFLLRTAYVRVLEDLGLLDPPRLRGQAGWQAWKAVAPRLGRRSFFRWLFRDLAVDFPALFAPGPDEPGLPSEDLCEEVWALWHREDGGSLVYELSDGDFDSRFLGDLYQDLDDDVRKRFALLQTPRFVETFILDYTLTPALELFDPGALLETGETFRLLDPTCGSGHFLTGGFERLFAWWTERFGKADVRWRIERALDSVWGSDLNPYAVAVARFRLLLAAHDAARREGVTLTLDELAALPVHLLVADSLIPWEGARGQSELWEESDPKAQLLARYATPVERAANAVFFGKAFHAVVGNPPYIAPPDSQKRDTYRTFWPDACYRKFILAAPFTERFFRLAGNGGLVGLINANSFLKRQHGKRLIEKVLPAYNLTHVVDVSGVTIPGNDTPSVILFGTNERPCAPTVRAVMKVRGESSGRRGTNQAKVWDEIATHVEAVGYSSQFISVMDLARPILGTHPWRLGGEGTLEILGLLMTGRPRLSEEAEDLGYSFVTAADEVYLLSLQDGFRLGLPEEAVRVISDGDAVEDWACQPHHAVVYPYTPVSMELSAPTGPLLEYLWPYRTFLWARPTFQGGTYRSDGRPWFEWHQFSRSKHRTPLGINFSEIGSHNHFVLDRGTHFLERTAPIVKLRMADSLDHHLGILGLLNSSCGEFWSRLTFQPKGGDKTSGKGRVSTEEWSDRIQRDSTKLGQFPLATLGRDARVALARRLDALATSRVAQLPAAVLASPAWTPNTLKSSLANAAATCTDLTEQMVALQEELDWLTYGSYGLLGDAPVTPPVPGALPVPLAPPDTAERLAPGHRPFEVLLARQVEAEEVETQWFARHGRSPVTDFPARYSGGQRERLEHRLALIESDDRLQLLEQPQFKRRWAVADFAAETKAACESWLLDRIEDLFAAGGALAEPRPYTLEEVSAALRQDVRVPAVLEVLAGTAAFDLEGTAGRLLAENALPDNPYRVHTDEGIRKLRRWQWVWEMQELEDRTPAGRPPLTFVDPDTGAKTESIPVPPKFDKGDFRKAAWFQLRGKLNVPRERFVAFADVDPPRWGWNGWRDAQRAAAQAEAAQVAMSHPEVPLTEPPTKDDPRRCGPVLGLWESLPDLRRWATAEVHEEQRAMAEYLCNRTSCPCEVVGAWRAWVDSGGKPGRQLAGVQRQAAGAELSGIASLEEKAAVLRSLGEGGETGMTLAELSTNANLKSATLRAALSALVAEGSVLEKSKRPKRWAVVRLQRELDLR
jgi:hypothetical protein